MSNDMFDTMTILYKVKDMLGIMIIFVINVSQVQWSKMLIERKQKRVIPSYSMHTHSHIYFCRALCAHKYTVIFIKCIMIILEDIMITHIHIFIKHQITVMIMYNIKVQKQRKLINYTLRHNGFINFIKQRTTFLYL